MPVILSNKKFWLLLLALVLLRLPNLDRPISKHHEFNTAIILLNAESWEQAGGGSHFSFTPLMNYQGAANKMLETGNHIDTEGNHVYLSFGTGWYVLPYFVFKALHLPFTPFWLQCLNIFIGLITAALFYRLLLAVTGKIETAWAGTLFFVLLPAPLWYCGIGYVTTSIMLPIVLGILWLWQRFEQDSHSINVKNLAALLLLGITLTFIDWLTPFLLGSMALWALLGMRKNKKYGWVLLTAAVTITIGIGLVLSQFASYLGWPQVLGYWQSRFLERSSDTSEYTLAQMLLMVAKNLVTGFLPLLLLLPLVFFNWKKIARKALPRWPFWMLGGVLAYNGLFLNWSAVHEFAWMAFALAASLVAGIFLFPVLTKKGIRILVTLLGLVSLTQYFIINRPGNKSWKGEAYAAQMDLGKWVRTNTDSSLPIFSNLANDKIVEFYAKRTFNSVADTTSAKKLAAQYNIKKAVWLQIDSFKVVENRVLELP